MIEKMKNFTLATLLMLMSCVEPRSLRVDKDLDRPRGLGNPNQKVFKPQTTEKNKHLNLTKRQDIDLSNFLEKYKDVKRITIQSNNRGSLSFHVEELRGGSHVNVIYSNTYKIIIEDNFGRKFHERIK